MKLCELKELLPQLQNVAFELPNGGWVPEHFHVTEVGLVTRHFIDCGGTIRNEQVVNFQLWNANDYEHRLKPQKLLNIIRLSEEKLGISNLDIEVEYQGDTIGKYGLSFANDHFVLENKTTACLAEEACGISTENAITALKPQPNSSCCGGGTC